MIEVSKIREIAEKELSGKELFVVDVTGTPGNEFEVTIDSDTSVDIDDCATLSRAIESHFDRDEEDFQLTVSSAGVGYPLKVYRQYQKLIGIPVEVVLRSGIKIIAELSDATEDSVTLSYEEMRTVEGKKKKQKFEVVKTYPLEEVKTTREHLDFK